MNISSYDWSCGTHALPALSKHAIDGEFLQAKIFPPFMFFEHFGL